MDLSIIIVNYRTYHLTKQVIESIITKDHSLSFDIYVVDNASGDGSLEKLKKDFHDEVDQGIITFISNPKNNGFAHANNVAIKRSSAKYILLLNSDTVILDDCLEKCVNYMESHEKIGALGCKVLLPDGSLDKACRRSFPDVDVSFYRMSGLSKIFPRSRRFGRYNLTYLDENETYEIECLVGAFMMVRREVINQIGLLDETFFMYGEDIDWCYRIKAAGWKIVYYADAEVIHYKGSSSSHKENPKLIYEFYRAMYLFYNKHYKHKYSWLVTALVHLGIKLNCRLKMFINNFKA
ncbi:MAG: glycosyltransferase family 2 protein [Methanobacteriaceae archaeon]|nr:glycosyltransferase family 2 protein [Methanobacteriaceae archaeon]